MKVGFIVECQKDGPDQKVIYWLLRNHATHVTPVFSPQTNKKGIEQNCGNAAKNLLADGCERVVIVWDLHPYSWETPEEQRQADRTPCLKEDRDKIYTALDAAGVDRQNVFLVAIEFMLESWLIADKAAIAALLNKKRRAAPVNAQGVGNVNPATEQRPKDALSKMFERNQKPAYKDYQHAEQIAREIADLNELRRHCPTFVRFWEKATEEQ